MSQDSRRDWSLDIAKDSVEAVHEGDLIRCVAEGKVRVVIEARTVHEREFGGEFWHVVGTLVSEDRAGEATIECQVNDG